MKLLPGLLLAQLSLGQSDENSVAHENPPPLQQSDITLSAYSGEEGYYSEFDREIENEAEVANFPGSGDGILEVAPDQDLVPEETLVIEPEETLVVEPEETLVVEPEEALEVSSEETPEVEPEETLEVESEETSSNEFLPSSSDSYEKEDEQEPAKATTTTTKESIALASESKKVVEVLTEKKAPESTVPINLPETPDIVIAIDMAKFDSDRWSDDTKLSNSAILDDFVKRLFESLANNFKLGGCLDELRVSIFKHDSQSVKYLVTANHFNKYLGTRKNCMQEETHPEFIKSKVIEALETPWSNVGSDHEREIDHNESVHENETDEDQAIHVFQHCKAVLDSYKNERKGEVWRRLHRWNYETRKVIVFVHDASDEDSAEFYQGLGNQAAELGYEVIPVSFSDNQDQKVKLNEMAKKTQRKGAFPPITLDISMNEIPFVISSYLKNTAALRPYTASLSQN